MIPTTPNGSAYNVCWEQYEYNDSDIAIMWYSDIDIVIIWYSDIVI